MIQPLRRLRPLRRAESIRELVFGVEDGAVQNVVLLAGMVGASVSTRVVVLAGAINALAGVVSMSMGTYLSSKAERDVARARSPGYGAGLRSPARDAMVMAGAYAVGASMPLLPFVVGGLDQLVALIVVLALAGITLFALGAVKASASRQSLVRSGVEMLLLASSAGVVGYLIGFAARGVFDLPV